MQPNIPASCSKCDSDNTELLSFSGKKVPGLLDRLFKPFTRRAEGKYIIKCKDCGHESVLIIN